MKSKTYQKEGWFIMDEEKFVFGNYAENEDVMNEENYFNLNNKNKAQAEKDIKNSAEELISFFEAASQDAAEPSEDEINRGIEKILEKAYPVAKPVQLPKEAKSKKVGLRVLFVAAILSILFVTCIGVVGNTNNISIENGFVTFAKDAIRIVFFGADKEEFIPVDALLLDLKAKGYKDILFPEEFVNNSDYKSTVPKYENSGLTKQVSFNITDGINEFSFFIYEHNSDLNEFCFPELDSAETIISNGNYIYLFELENEQFILFFYNGLIFDIQFEAPYSDMLKIAESIK